MTNSRVVIPIAAAKTVTAKAFVPAATANKRNASPKKPLCKEWLYKKF